mmetsp:Transcript_26000/g.75096  ORF Transcript_26000/g.75096 Transcript_26000/m.75096 type:complete len:268 (+) Transcript_26000:129-932(+)
MWRQCSRRRPSRGCRLATRRTQAAKAKTISARRRFGKTAWSRLPTLETLEAFHKIPLAASRTDPITCPVFVLPARRNPFSHGTFPHWDKLIFLGFAQRPNVVGGQLAIMVTVELERDMLTWYVSRLQFRAQVLPGVVDVLSEIGTQHHEEPETLPVETFHHAVQRGSRRRQYRPCSRYQIGVFRLRRPAFEALQAFHEVALLAHWAIPITAAVFVFEAPAPFSQAALEASTATSAAARAAEERRSTHWPTRMAADEWMVAEHVDDGG